MMPRAIAALAATTVTLAGVCIPPKPSIAAVASSPAATSRSPPPLPSSPLPVRKADGMTLTGTPQQGGLLIGQLAKGVMNLTLDGLAVRTASDGAFIIGFSSDAGPSAILRATLPNGRATEIAILVAPRLWRVETVASIPRFAQPSAEFARLRPPELAAITAARRIDASAQGWRQRFIWPVSGRISGVFGSQRVYANGERGAPHAGVDIARPTGTPVVAPADGVIVLAADRPFTLEGNLLMIDHGMGLNSAFLHLSRIDVRVGDRVRQGQTVGAIGATGRASGPHLHWGMKWLDRRIDPQPLAGPMLP